MTTLIKLPLSAESAHAIVETIQAAWNSIAPERVILFHSMNTQWRSQEKIVQGRNEAYKHLEKIWAVKLHYRLKMELWSHTDTRISVRFEYEWQHAKTGQWYRTYGNEHWEFNNEGLIHYRDVCANDTPITSDQRYICK